MSKLNLANGFDNNTVDGGRMKQKRLRQRFLSVNAQRTKTSSFKKCLKFQIETCPAWDDDVVSAALHVAVLDIVDIQHEVLRRGDLRHGEREDVPGHLRNIEGVFELLCEKNTFCGTDFFSSSGLDGMLSCA